MAIDILSEGDALAAATLNSIFADGAASLNALGEQAFRRWALDTQHLPPSVDDTEWPTFSAYSPNPLSIAQTYSNTIPGDLAAPDYTTFDGTGTPIYGPGSGSGWRIVSYTGSLANAAKVQFPVKDLLGIVGIEADFSVDLRDTPSVNDQDLGAVVALGFEDSLGGLYVVEGSAAYYSNIAFRRGPVHAWHVITAADIVAGNGDIVAVFGVIGNRQYHQPHEVDDDLVVKGYHVSIMPVRAGSL